MALTLETALRDVEVALYNVLRRHLQVRLTAATLVALRALVTKGASGTTSVRAGNLVYVTTVGFAYEWDATNTDADDDDTTVLPDDRDVADPGRWMITSDTHSSGTIVRVAYWQGETRKQEFAQRLFAKRPAVGVVFESAENEPRSTIPGAIYDYPIRMSLWCVDENLRAGYEALLGGDPSAPGHPGAFVIAGRVKKVLADENKRGTATLDLDGGIKIIRLGSEDIEDADLAERLMVVSLGVEIVASVENPDDDSEHVAVSDVRVQPLFGHDNEEAEFDNDNHVVSGFRVLPQMGFTATPTVGSAIIGGAAVSVTPAAHTFDSVADIYMDLASDGTITYRSRNPGADAPSVDTDSIRIARIVTDTSGIVSWEPVTAQAAAFGDAYSVVP